MRIIAGQSKGMRLVAPEGREVRPTSDLMRGAIMSSLGGHFDGERVLDVCAGTGAIALEFLSRGCGSAVAIEADPAALAVLGRNAEHVRQNSKLRVMALDALKALRLLATEGQVFDFVYVDPPYDAGLAEPILQALLDGALLSPGALVLVETRKGIAGLSEKGWHVLAERRYGSSVLLRLEHLHSKELESL